MAVDQVEEIKMKSDIVSVVGERVKLKKAGRNYKGLCPFHSEKTPSFMVSPELQIYKCFGCGEAGDAYTFLQRYEGMDFPESLEYLAKRVGVRLKRINSGDSRGKQQLYDLVLNATKFYHYVLMRHKAGSVARLYVTKDRGLKLNTIKKFQIGYSPNVQFAIKGFLSEKKGYKEKEIVLAGIAVQTKRGVSDRFRGRLIFPLFDHRGNAVGFAGRLMPGDERKDLAKYINSPETNIYHKSEVLYGLNATKSDIKKAGEAVVVEGELDMISAWQAGVKNVVAIKGTALTEQQIKLLKRFTERIVLALDADAAGDNAARRGIVMAETEGLFVRVAKMGRHKDPDDFARKDPKGFVKSISKSIEVWDYFIDSALSRFNTASAEGKSRVSRELLPILSLIKDEIVRAHYVTKLAKRLNVPIDAISSQMSKITRSSESSDSKAVEMDPGPTKDRRTLLEERLLTLSFQHDPTILKKRNVSKSIKFPLNRRILDEYISYTNAGKKYDPAEFAAAIPKELVAGYTDILLMELGGVDMQNNDAVEREIEFIISELSLVDIKGKLEKVAKNIKTLEDAGEIKKLQKEEKKFNKLTHTLSKLEDNKVEGIILK